MVTSGLVLVNDNNIHMSVARETAYECSFRYCEAERSIIHLHSHLFFFFGFDRNRTFVRPCRKNSLLSPELLRPQFRLRRTVGRRRSTNAASLPATPNELHSTLHELSFGIIDSAKICFHCVRLYAVVMRSTWVSCLGE